MKEKKKRGRKKNLGPFVNGSPTGARREEKKEKKKKPRKKKKASLVPRTPAVLRVEKGGTDRKRGGKKGGTSCREYSGSVSFIPSIVRANRRERNRGGGGKKRREKTALTDYPLFAGTLLTNPREKIEKKKDRNEEKKKRGIG